MWVIFAIGAALLTSFNPILYKRMLQGADPLIVVWAVIGSSLPLLGLFTIALTRQVPGLDWLFAMGVLCSAALNVAAHLASSQSLKLADASLVAPLLIFSPVFTALLSALVLNEIPSVRGLLGISLVLVGAYWLNRQAGSDWFTPLKALAFKPGVALVLLAGLLWAITPLFEKIAIQHTEPSSPQFAAFVVNLLLVAMLTPSVVWRGRRALTKLRLHQRSFVLAGLIAGTAPVLGYTAFSLGYVGYVTTLFKLSTVMTVVWSALFLKEPGLAQRLPSSFLMVLGAILIAV